MCESISALYEGRLLLGEGTAAWEYKVLGNSPFYLMVDEGRLGKVLVYLEAQIDNMDSGLRWNDE